jgi:hypothetical protein
MKSSACFFVFLPQHLHAGIKESDENPIWKQSLSQDVYLLNMRKGYHYLIAGNYKIKRTYIECIP